MRYLFLMLIITVLILGYGYWHVSTHATLNISLYDFSVEKSFILLKESNIILREGSGKVLAMGQSDARYGTIYLAHPETGSCYEAEHKATRSRDAMNTWQICFKQNSTWK